MWPGFGLLLLLTGSGLLADSFFTGEDAPQKDRLALFLMMAGIGLFLERGEPTRP